MNISAVLLAGGESRRMGRDKATLLFRGNPLWQTQIDLLRKLEPVEILVSARTDPSWRPADVKFVSDNSPSRGPLSGLIASLAGIRTSHLLALAIDMPRMNETYLRFICDQREPGRGVLPLIGNRPEPLAALYPVDAHVDLVAAVSGFEFSLQRVTKKLIETGKLKVLSVREEDREFFQNLNEPADLA
jgi:molybdopterin-guanine dinucleotide biosynthesis protein A